MVLVGNLKDTGGSFYISTYGINFRYVSDLNFKVSSRLDQNINVQTYGFIMVFVWDVEDAGVW